MSAPVQLKYRAFLSYAHADAKWGTWLHKALEGYRVDSDLVGRATSLGPVPKSLAPIFRDRDEFSGGHSLTEATLAALDASAALIVVCSPRAALSHYVNEEVRLFRSRHPERPVIPVIIDGRPNAPSPRSRGEGWGEGQPKGSREGQQRSDVPAAAPHPDPLPVEGTGRGNDECFPRALRFEVAADGAVTETPVTILGPDLRASADGKDLGLAKISAGLTGLAADDLFKRLGRERRRQRIETTAVAALMIALAGVGGWLGIETREQGRVIASKSDSEQKALVLARKLLADKAGGPSAPGRSKTSYRR